MSSVDKRAFIEEGHRNLEIHLQVKLPHFSYFHLPLHWLDKFSILSNTTSIILLFKTNKETSKKVAVSLGLFLKLNCVTINLFQSWMPFYLPEHQLGQAIKAKRIQEP